MDVPLGCFKLKLTYRILSSVCVLSGIFVARTISSIRVLLIKGTGACSRDSLQGVGFHRDRDRAAGKLRRVLREGPGAVVILFDGGIVT